MSETGVNPLVRVMSPDEVTAQQDQEAAIDAQTADQAPMGELASHIRRKLELMRNYRETEGINRRLLEALRAYRGEYNPDQLNDIRQFQGSEVYAKVTATKCRAATSLLRDIYLSVDRPWGVEPTPSPSLPGNVRESISTLVASEISTMRESGQPIDQEMVRDRVTKLHREAMEAAREAADSEAEEVSRKLNDMLTEGGFYDAVGDFLCDIPIFPYAVIKGPIIQRKPTMKWVNGRLQRTVSNKPTWARVSPFDLYWSPEASKVKDSEFVERLRLTRNDLASMRELPGFDKEAIDQILEQYEQNGNYRWWDSTDLERSNLEDKDTTSHHGLIEAAEFHGEIPGRMLKMWGFENVENDHDEYHVTAWLIDRHVIKVQVSPFSYQPNPYYIGRYTKVPGSLIGEGLPDLLDDIQQVCNATLRSLVNNLAISSGPQVAINDSAIAPGENDELYPWKRWHFNLDPHMQTSGQHPIEFWQAQSNAQELLGVYQQFSVMADEVSAIPKYMTGNEKGVGGAGRTASGLSMLIANASKSLQNVAAGIDNDVMRPLLNNLYEYLMLTDPGVFRGDEEIVVKGVNYAVKREQDRMRQLEFLQLTANPLDSAIVGPANRAKILNSVSEGLGLERVVPDHEDVEARMQQQPQLPDGSSSGGASRAPEQGRAPPEAARQQVEGEV